MMVDPTKTRKRPFVAAVIVGYNSESYLEDCLGSLFRSDYGNFKVYFIDNASSDGTVELVTNRYPEVMLIREKNNLGFAAGNNVGIKQALKDGVDYVFLLNPDTVTDPSCLSTLTSNANDNTILQPLILLHDDTNITDTINSEGNPLHFLGFSYAGNMGKQASYSMTCKDIPLASGAAMFIPAKIIKNIGAFDELLFMYHEDVDLSWRARIAGYNIQLISNAKIWHKYAFSRNKNKLYYAERNRLIFLWKNFQLKTLILIFPSLVINEIFMIFYCFGTKTLSAKLNSYYGFFKMLPRVSKTNDRVVSDRDLCYLMTSRLFPFSSSPVLRLYNVPLIIYWSLIKQMI